METIFNVFHGTVAGGTTCYLQDRLVKEKNSQNSDVWITAALQFNHLLLLTAETIYSANITLEPLGLFVRTITVLTPLVLFVGFRTKKISNFESWLLENFNRFYLIGVVVNIVATFTLGNPAFAIASLMIMILNAYTTSKLEKMLDPVKKGLASCALIGYGAQVFTAEGLMADCAKLGTIMMAAKLWIFNDSDKIKPISNKPIIQHPAPQNSYYRSYGSGYSAPRSGLNWNLRLRSGWGWGNPFVRSGAWG